MPQEFSSQTPGQSVEQPSPELTLEQFTTQATELLKKLNKVKAVVCGNFADVTHERRKEAAAEWDNLYKEFVALATRLFRDVGGAAAFKAYRVITEELQTKFGYQVNFANDKDEIKLLAEILTRATQKAVSTQE